MELKYDLLSQEKANIIYDIVGNFACGCQIYYDEWDGTLHFNFRIPSGFGYLEARITPVKDKYKIHIRKGINIATTMILYEVDGIDKDKLYDTFQGIVDYLDKEWIELQNSKIKKYITWWDYKKGKEIKYNDHGHKIAVNYYLEGKKITEDANGKIIAVC